MADKAVPEGLDAIGRDLLDTDRIIVEKKRATLAELLTLIDSYFALANLQTQANDATTAIATAEGDIDDLETRATGLETLAASTYVVTLSSATVPAGTTDVLILTAGAVALQMQDVVDTGRVRIHTHSGTGAVTLSRSAADATASGVFQSAAGTANTCVLSAPNAFRQGRTWSLTPKMQGVPTWYVHDGESLSVDDLSGRMTIAENDIVAFDGRLDDLEGVVVETGTSINVAADTRHLILTNTGTINLTWPDATSAICCHVYAASGESTQTINFLRSAADIAAGTINGVVNDKSVVRTSASSDEAYQSWVMRGAGPGAWILDLGASNALENIRYSISGLQSADTALDGRLDALEGGFTLSANIRNLTTAGPHTIVAGETLVQQSYAGAMVLTAPAATKGALHVVVKETTNAGTITWKRAGSDTIHGSASDYVLNGSDYVTSATTPRMAWIIRCLTAGEWTITTLTDDARLDTIEAAATALTARVTALEVPSALLCDTATETWTTEAEADVTYASGTCTIGLDGDTTQWPVGVSRPVNKVNTSVNTIVLDPQPTHTINGVAAGTNVTLVNSAVVAGASVSAGVWRIKRLSSTSWWAQ